MFGFGKLLMTKATNQSVQLLPDISLPKATCKRFYSFGWQIKRWECLRYCIWHILDCQHSKNKAFPSICISVLKDAEQSCQANEHLSSISKTAALTTTRRFKLKNMKVFVLVIQEIQRHKDTSLESEPSGFSPFASEHCMPLSFRFDGVFVGGFPSCTSSFPPLLLFWPDFSIPVTPGLAPPCDLHKSRQWSSHTSRQHTEPTSFLQQKWAAWCIIHVGFIVIENWCMLCR